jgi:hypothetical protein
MTRVTGKNIDNLGRMLGKKSDKLQSSIDEFYRSDVSQDKALKEYLGRVVYSA